MKFYTEQQRDIPVDGEYDVIVAGSGTAAALAVKHGTGLRDVNIKELQKLL